MLVKAVEVMQTEGSLTVPSDINAVFLGLGGDGPAVCVFASHGSGDRQLAELPEGQSVYAIDVCTDTGRVAYGTRGGMIQTICWPPQASDRQAPSQWSHGSPVLSICWVTDALLAVADTAGRCLLWNPVAPAEPKRLDSEGCIICSLQMLPDGELVGLSGDGCLLFWSIPEGHLLRCVQGVPPPPKLALVHLRFWQRERLLMYPADDGRLCLLSPDGMRLRYVDAHRGPFYVVLPGPKGVLTVGGDERLIRSWDRLPGSPAWEAVVPWSRHFVSGWSIGFQPDSVLLIDREGTGAVFVCTDGKIRFSRQLVGANYRTVAGQPAEEVARRHAVQRLTQASHLYAEAKEQIQRGQPGGLQRLADELAALGFKRMALGIRARCAHLENRLLDELRLRKELMELLGPGPAARASARQYVLLLKMLWRLPEAWSVCRTYCSVDDGDDWLTQAAAVMASGTFVAEPDVPLSLIVDAANLLEEALTGTWVVASSEAMNLPPECSLEAFLEKYEQLRASVTTAEPVPAPTCQHVKWISQDLIADASLIGLTSSGDRTGVCLHSALRFERGDGLGVLTPVLLLQARALTPETPAATANTELLRILEIAGTPRGVSAQQWEVQRLVTELVRRLWTASAWQRNQSKGK